MALNIPGVVMMVVFYVLILGTGLWGARKSRSAGRLSSGDRTAVVLLGDRRISLLIGIFTMTGMCACSTQVELSFAQRNCIGSHVKVLQKSCKRKSVFAGKVCILQKLEKY